MIRPSHLLGLALLALALCQSAGAAHAATASTSFAITVRVASVCEANGLCGAAKVVSLGTQATPAAATLVTPLAPTADRDAGQRIQTPQNAGPVEVDF